MKPYERNAKRHPQTQIEQLVASIKEFGWTRPVLVDDRGIVAGHGAVMAAKRIYETKGRIKLPNGQEIPIGTVPVLDVSGWTEAQRKAYIIADNRLSEGAIWDIGILHNELMDLRTVNFDLSLTGFKEDDAALIFNEADSIDDVDETLPGVQELKRNVIFESDLPYGIPHLLPDRIIKWPTNLRTFCGRNLTPDDGTSTWLWNWRSYSIQGLPKHRHIIGFYADDSKFEAVFTDPAKWTAKILNMGSLACIAPNFSMYEFAPKVLNIYAVYRARYVARYFQEAGIPVIPDVNWGGDETYDFCFLGIPEGVPFSVQMQTYRHEQDKERFLSGLKEAIRRLRPPEIMVYAEPTNEYVLQEAGIDVPYHLVPNRLSEVRRIMRERGQEQQQQEG